MSVLVNIILSSIRIVYIYRCIILYYFLLACIVYITLVVPVYRTRLLLASRTSMALMLCGGQGKGWLELGLG